MPLSDRVFNVYAYMFALSHTDNKLSLNNHDFIAIDLKVWHNNKVIMFKAIAIWKFSVNIF